MEHNRNMIIRADMFDEMLSFVIYFIVLVIVVLIYIEFILFKIRVFDT